MRKKIIKRALRFKNTATSWQKPILVRFFERIFFCGECWEWNGALNEDGYGRFSLCMGGEESRWQAHRASYHIFKGAIGPDMTIDHVCKNRKCVNPFHLRQLTILENVVISYGSTWIKRRMQTHCLRGHPFDEANTYLRSNGKRNCRACAREALNEGRNKRRGK
jgi:hypothetical protein